jgi:hypothetical protein
MKTIQIYNDIKNGCEYIAEGSVRIDKAGEIELIREFQIQTRKEFLHKHYNCKLLRTNKLSRVEIDIRPIDEEVADYILETEAESEEEGGDLSVSTVLEYQNGELEINFIDENYHIGSEYIGWDGIKPTLSQLKSLLKD